MIFSGDQQQMMRVPVVTVPQGQPIQGVVNPNPYHPGMVGQQGVPHQQQQMPRGGGGRGGMQHQHQHQHQMPPFFQQGGMQHQHRQHQGGMRGGMQQPGQQRRGGMQQPGQQRFNANGQPQMQRVQQPRPVIADPLAHIATLKGEIFAKAKTERGNRELQDVLEKPETAGEVAAIMLEEMLEHVPEAPTAEGEEGEKEGEEKEEKKETPAEDDGLSPAAKAMAELMSDTYANFVLGKLFAVLPTESRVKLLTTVAPNLRAIAETQHGNHSVQRLVSSVVSLPEADILAGIFLTPATFGTSALDSNGHYVVEKLLEKVCPLIDANNLPATVSGENVNSAEGVKNAVDTMVADATTYCTHPNGNYVFKAALRVAPVEYRTALVGAAQPHTAALIKDKYGNYVVQQIVQSPESSAADGIAEQLIPELADHALNKNSCNVVKKLFHSCSQDERRKVVDTLMTEAVLGRVMQDGLGNFVVQEALVTLAAYDAEYHKKLSDAVRANIHLVPNWQRNFESKLDGAITQDAAKQQAVEMSQMQTLRGGRTGNKGQQQQQGQGMGRGGGLPMMMGGAPMGRGMGQGRGRGGYGPQ